jgi:hypothetical protein
VTDEEERVRRRIAKAKIGKAIDNDASYIGWGLI